MSHLRIARCSRSDYMQSKEDDMTPMDILNTYTIVRHFTGQEKMAACHEIWPERFTLSLLSFIYTLPKIRCPLYWIRQWQFIQVIASQTPQGRVPTTVWSGLLSSQPRESSGGQNSHQTPSRPSFKPARQLYDI